VSLLNCGSQTQGIVACNQMRTLDFKARNARFIESVPDYVMDDVLARLQAVLE
jgi:mRNA interferase ChpB